MKTFIFGITLFLGVIGTTQAANLPLNFETGTYDITNFDGGVLTLIDNPKSAGINTSTKVAQMIKNSGKNWAGSYITLDNPIDFSVGTLFKMKVFSPKKGTKVLLKVVNAVSESIYFEKEETTKLANEWEEVTFDFSKIDVKQSYRKVVVIFDLGTMGDGSANFTYLFDDIALTQGTSDNVPSTAPPTPPVYAADKVISIFSDAYTDLDGTNFNPYWQQKTVGSIIELDENNVLKLLNLNYQGIELASDVNAASMQYLHIDVWTANETKLEIYPISRTTGEKKANLAPLVQKEWNSFDIKLADILSSSYNLADLFQFKFVGAGGNTVYIDNLYLYNNNPEADTEEPKNFTASASPVTYNSIKLLLNASDNSGAINYSITLDDTTTIIGAASGVQKSYEFTRLPSSTEFTFSITAEDLSGNKASNNPIQLVVSTKDAFPEPLESAPTPPSLSSENVISIFSNSYNNISGINFNPYWQQTTWYESKFIGNDEILKYENFNYQGIEIGRKVNATGMQFLHIDVWTPNETSLKIAPVSQSSGEKEVRLTPIKLNEWNSYNISLKSFTNLGLLMSDIIHLKLVGSGKSIIYIDNIYFYTEKTSNPQHLTKDDFELFMVNNQLNLKTYEKLLNGTIEIYDISGHQLMHKSITKGLEQIEISNQGILIIQISDAAKQAITIKKIVVQ